MDWIVYEHISPSGKVYVGITSNINKRWANKGYYYQLKDSIFARAIRKYGWDNFTHNILYTGLTLKEAANKEIELIAVLKSLNNSYNIADGGQEYKGKHSKEHVEKIINSRIANNKTKILVIDKNFNYIEFNSKVEADRYLNVSKGVVGHVLRQPIGYTCKGYYLVELPKEELVDMLDISEKILKAVNDRKEIQLNKNKKSIKKAILASLIERQHLTAEENISRYTNHRKGYKHSIETKKKMSVSAKNRKKKCITY